MSKYDHTQGAYLKLADETVTVLLRTTYAGFIATVMRQFKPTAFTRETAIEAMSDAFAYARTLIGATPATLRLSNHSPHLEPETVEQLWGRVGA